MKSSIIKFANKLELRYFFNDKSTYIDSSIRHRCEKEILNLIRSLSDMLDVKLMVYNEPYSFQEGYKDIWSVAGENPRCISVVLNMAMQILVRPILSVGGQPLMERHSDDDEKMQKEVSLFKRSLKLEAKGVPSHLMDLLSNSPRFCKIKSNFYEAIKGYPKVTKITLRELNESNRSRSGLLEVKRENFDYYILRSDDLPPVKDQRATIEIISPVLKDARYRWKGIYNKGGVTIDFYMQDEDFKKQMIDNKMAFSSGMCIDCVLEISRKLSELGEIINVSYVVTTVIRTRFDKMEILTPQGKRHLKKLEAEKRQLTLDLFG